MDKTGETHLPALEELIGHEYENGMETWEGAGSRNEQSRMLTVEKAVFRFLKLRARHCLQFSSRSVSRHRGSDLDAT
jgi:hypothetical protein